VTRQAPAFGAAGERDAGDEGSMAMAANDLDYSLWKENDGERDRWMWEVMVVDDDGEETNITGGIADTKADALLEIGTAMRNAKV
jgi:hypothetical protein